MAAFAWGGMQLDVRTDVTQLMPPDLPSMQTLQLIRDDGQGAANLDVVVSVPDKSFRDDGQLSLLYELENELVNRFNEIDSVRSITRVIEGLYSRDGHSGFPGEFDFHCASSMSTAAARLSRYNVSRTGCATTRQLPGR
jgi:predicted RND superfamily exporter protein